MSRTGQRQLLEGAIIIRLRPATADEISSAWPDDTTKWYVVIELSNGGSLYALTRPDDPGPGILTFMDAGGEEHLLHAQEL